MEPQDTLTQIGAIAGIAAAVWVVVRDVVPLTFRSVRRTREWLKQNRLNRQTARERKANESRRAAQELLARERAKTEAKLRDALRSAVVRLHEMESGNASYYATEWKSQKSLCKDAVFGIAQYMDYQFSTSGSNWNNVACTNYETDTIIFHVVKSRWRKRTLQLYILVHPSPSLTNDQYGWSELNGGSATVLSTPFTTADLTRLGWEFPDEWEAWEPKRIPGRSLPEFMTLDAINYRRVRDWDPNSPFASLKLPD